jgi:hypothetical protein
MDGNDPTTGDLRPGERVELVALGEALLGLEPGERGTVAHVEPLLIIVFDTGPMIGILPQFGDEVRRVGP